MKAEQNINMDTVQLELKAFLEALGCVEVVQSVVRDNTIRFICRVKDQILWDACAANIVKTHFGNNYTWNHHIGTILLVDKKDKQVKRANLVAFTLSETDTDASLTSLKDILVDCRRVVQRATMQPTTTQPAAKPYEYLGSSPLNLVGTTGENIKNSFGRGR